MVVWHDLKVGKQNPHHIFRASYSLQDYIPGRAVHSASRNLICERRTKTATGARACGVHGCPQSLARHTIYRLHYII